MPPLRLRASLLGWNNFPSSTGLSVSSAPHALAAGPVLFDFLSRDHFPVKAPLCPSHLRASRGHTIPQDKGATSERTQESARSPQLLCWRSQIIEPQRTPLAHGAHSRPRVFRFGPEETLPPVPCGLLVRSVIFQPSDDTQVCFPPLAQVERKVMLFDARCHLSKISGGFPEKIQTLHIRFYELESVNCILQI